mmetsp:Transcript_22078/g.54625  ORF Transcript_22078/g.54625 Transcript_22078/m.54625 type:complete len:328 (+) Transcript_22078:1166-2149(+)
MVKTRILFFVLGRRQGDGEGSIVSLAGCMNASARHSGTWFFHLLSLFAKKLLLAKTPQVGSRLVRLGIEVCGYRSVRVEFRPGIGDRQDGKRGTIGSAVLGLLFKARKHATGSIVGEFCHKGGRQTSSLQVQKDNVLGPFLVFRGKLTRTVHIGNVKAFLVDKGLVHQKGNVSLSVGLCPQPSYTRIVERVVNSSVHPHDLVSNHKVSSVILGLTELGFVLLVVDLGHLLALGKELVVVRICYLIALVRDVVHRKNFVVDVRLVNLVRPESVRHELEVAFLGLSHHRSAASVRPAVGCVLGYIVSRLPIGLVDHKGKTLDGVGILLL